MEDVTTMAIVLLVVLAIVLCFWFKPEPAKKVCTRCHAVGLPRNEVRGSFGIEVLLWICFIIPGVLYSFWRLSSKRPVCQTCGSDALVPVNSPAGMAIAEKHANGRSDVLRDLKC
jgi:hypothetical protein